MTLSCRSEGRISFFDLLLLFWCFFCDPVFLSPGTPFIRTKRKCHNWCSYLLLKIQCTTKHEIYGVKGETFSLFYGMPMGIALSAPLRQALLLRFRLHFHISRRKFYSGWTKNFHANLFVHKSKENAKWDKVTLLSTSLLHLAANHPLHIRLPVAQRCKPTSSSETAPGPTKT